MACLGIDNLKEEFAKDLKNKLNTSSETDEDNERVSWIVSNTTSCLHQHDHIEWLTTKSVVGMKALCRGWIVKHWVELEKSQDNVMKRMNKIVVKNVSCFIQKCGNKETKCFTIVKIIVSLQLIGMKN